MKINSLSVSFLIAGVINTLLGTFLYVKSRKRFSNRIFSFFTFQLALWCFIDFFIASAVSLSFAALMIRTAFAVGAFLPSTFYLFAVSMGKEKLSRDEIRNISLFYSASLLIAILCFSPNFISRVFWVPLSSKKIIMPGPEVEYGRITFSLYILGVISMMIMGLGYLYRKKRAQTGLLLLEIQYVFIGVLMGTVFTTFTSLIPSLFGTSIPARFAPFSSVIMVGIIAYGIAKYKIMDMSLVYESLILYSSLSLSLGLIYFIIFISINILTREVSDVRPSA